MGFKKIKANAKTPFLTKKEKFGLLEGSLTFHDIFEDKNPNLQVSFFPNGSDEIWIRDKSDPSIGLSIGIGLGDRGLLVQVRALHSTNQELHNDDLTKSIKGIIQLKKNQT